MQRQRGELVPIGDALSGLGGPVKRRPWRVLVERTQAR